MNNPKTGDLVYIIDPDGDEPIMMGVGLVVGETKKHEHAPGLAWKISTPVLWDDRDGSISSTTYPAVLRTAACAANKTQTVPAAIHS